MSNSDVSAPAATPTTQTNKLPNSTALPKNNALNISSSSSEINGKFSNKSCIPALPEPGLRAGLFDPRLTSPLQIKHVFNTGTNSLSGRVPSDPYLGKMRYAEANATATRVRSGCAGTNVDNRHIHELQFGLLLDGASLDLNLPLQEFAKMNFMSENFNFLYAVRKFMENFRENDPPKINSKKIQEIYDQYIEIPKGEKLSSCKDAKDNDVAVNFDNGNIVINLPAPVIEKMKGAIDEGQKNGGLIPHAHNIFNEAVWEIKKMMETNIRQLAGSTGGQGPLLRAAILRKEELNNLRLVNTNESLISPANSPLKPVISLRKLFIGGSQRSSD